MREFVPGRAAAHEADIKTDRQTVSPLDEPARIVCLALVLAMIAVAIRIAAIW